VNSHRSPSGATLDFYNYANWFYNYASQPLSIIGREQETPPEERKEWGCCMSL